MHSNNEKGGYIIKSKRLANFLYTLGFNYKNIPNAFGDGFVYAFRNTDELQEAMSFYTVFKKEHKDKIL